MKAPKARTKLRARMVRKKMGAHKALKQTKSREVRKK